MSFGIMGLSAAFAKAASAHVQKLPENYIIIKATSIDPILKSITCHGDVVVISTKNGSQLKESYRDLDNVQLSIQADADTNVIIYGDITQFVVKQYGQGCSDLTEINTSHAPNLTKLICDGNNNITSLDVSNNNKLTSLSVEWCRGLSSIDLQNNLLLGSFSAKGSALTALSISGLNELHSINLEECTSLTSLSIHDCQNLNLISVQGTQYEAMLSMELINLPNFNSFNTENSTFAAVTEIKYPATNSSISTTIANIITAATAADGTVYTDSAAVYYSTIADAATAKGWTIEQL